MIRLHKQFLHAFAKLQKSDYWLRHMCLSVRMEQIDSHWMDFHDI